MMKSIFYFLTLCVVMTLSVAVIAQPANDACANAQPISLPSSGQACVSGNNTGATDQTWTTTPCGQATWTSDVWYTFVSTGPYTSVTVTPSGASPASQVGVAIYSTADCLNFNGAGGAYCNISATAGGSAQAFANLAVGTTYYVEVSTFGAAGSYQVCVSSTNPPNPPGSTCGTATKVCNMSPFSLANVPAGGSFWPDCFDLAPQAGVWYKFSVGVSGQLAFQCTPSEPGIELDWAVYDVTSGCPTFFNQSGEVSCNFNYSSAASNPIGMQPGSTTLCPINADPGVASGEYCPSQTVLAGRTYAIFINNYSDPDPTGWDFNWNNSTFKMAPVDSFVVDPDTICGTSGTVNFTNLSSGASWQTWNFGDNTTSTVVTPPAHTYNSPGTYFITLKDSTPTGCTAVSSKSVLITPNPTVTVANDTICGGNATLTAVPSLPGGTYHWNTGPATSSITVSPAVNTTYSVVYTSPTGCTGTGSGSVILAGSANAGVDKTVPCAVLPGGSTTMSGTGTGTWTALAGNPGTATITPLTSPTATISNFSAAGVYKFSWGGGACIDTAQIIVTAKPNAGTDKTACQYTSATLGATGTGTWSLAAGNPGAAVITTPTSPTSTVTALNAAGTYNFVWTSGGCTDTAAVAVTAKPNAGADKTVLCAVLPGGTATMAAAGTGTWSAVTGNPGTTTIVTPGSATTTITGFPLAGIYGYVWTSGGCTDTATVTVTAKPDAGADQTVNCVTGTGGTATMAATGTGTWTAITGNPATTTITTPAASNTTITGLTAAGIYYYAWTSGGCPDTATVTVTAKPNAGTDQTINCVVVSGGSATMAASPASGLWTAVPGNAGTSAITNPSSATTTITTFSAVGVYRYIWTSGGCPDTVSITINAPPLAGPDQTVNCATLTGGTATMAASGSGTWTAQTGNPGTATISAPGSPTTTIINYTAAGVYHFIWTSGTCSDTAAVTVTAKPYAGADKLVNCAILPGGSVAMSATGTGTWAALTAINPGTATITTPASNVTTITTYSAAGVYYFTWSNAAGCLDTATVTVTAKPNAGNDQAVTCAVLPGGTATMAATGTGIWTAIAGNPGAATITSPTVATTTITTFPAAGTYRYAWTNGTCADTAAVTVTAQPAAGANQVVTCITLPGGTATMAGSGTGTWSAGPGTNPGTATIVSPASPTTNIVNFSAAGVYTFTLTNGACTSTATVTVSAQPNAGADKVVTCATLPGGTATMAATTTTGTWSAVAGNPGTAAITNPASATTTITTFPVAGTYRFVWANGTCYDTAAVVVTAKPNAGPDQVVDCYPMTNTATMAATGTGLWTAQTGNAGTATIATTNDPVTTITGFSALGVYHFIWSSGGCTDTATVTVTARPNAGPDQTVSCIILPGGTATMAAVGSGVWSGLATNPSTPTITNPNLTNTTITTFGAAGAYYFVWTVNGCTDTARVTVIAKPDAGPDQTVCQYTTATGAAVGTGTWSVQAGNPAPTVITTPSSATTGITGFLIPGGYNYIWTVNGCTDTMTINVTAKPNAGADQTICQYTDATMIAAGTGTWATIPGNPSPTTITNTTDPLTTITGYALPGAYSYEWTVNGCADTTVITVTAKPAAGADQNICQRATATMAGSTGTGTWTALSSNPNFTTIANPSQYNTNITGFTNLGVYSFVWTVSGCSDTVDIYVNTQPTVSVRDTAVCAGNSATLTAVPSDPGGSFLWDISDPNPSITVSPASTTTYTVTYTLGICVAQATGRVTINNLPVVSVATANSNCTANNGQAWAVVSGTGPYTYLWNVPGTRDTITGLTPGSYDVTVTDNIGCRSNASGTVGLNNPTLNINLVSQHNLKCNGDNSGSIVVSATGSGTLTYVWTPSANGPAISNLSAQTYSLVATDRYGCTGTAQYTLTEPAAMTVAMTYTDPHCPGSSDGTVTATPAGGSGTYHYEWNTTPAQYTQTATGLEDGTYDVTVTDDSSCVVTGTISVIDPDATTFGSGSVTDARCHGSSDGTATVNPQGNFGPYMYRWNDPGNQVSQQATGLAAGQYTVTVTDMRGCTVSTIVWIGEPSILTVTLTETDLTCYQNKSGTATASIQGGTVPYRYAWSNGDSTAHITGLQAGPYLVTATDGLGCTATGSITITQPVAVEVNRTAYSTNCAASTDGSITVTGSAGAGGPYSYALKDIVGNTIQSNTSGSFTGLGAQLYTVVVTDRNGCSSSDTVTVPRAAFNVYSAIPDSTSCFGPEYRDGRIHLEGLTIPNGPFLYQVDNGAQQDIPDFYDLAAGPHDIHIVDAHGCDTSFVVIVGEPVPASVDILPGDSTIELGSSLPLYTAFRPYSVSAITSYTWSPAEGMSCIDCANPVVSPFATQNTYTVTVTYNKGCIAVTTVHINTKGDPATFVPNAFSPNGDGENDVLNVYGEGIKNIKMMIFNRWGEKVYETTNQSQGWDGTYKGQLQEPGVYTYVVDIIYLNEHKRVTQGTITLLR